MALTMVHYAPVVTKLRCVLSRQLRLAVYLPSCATFGFLPGWLTGPNYSLSNTWGSLRQAASGAWMGLSGAAPPEQPASQQSAPREPAGAPSHTANARHYVAPTHFVRELADCP
jgi:hypothetical protein